MAVLDFKCLINTECVDVENPEYDKDGVIYLPLNFDNSNPCFDFKKSIFEITFFQNGESEERDFKLENSDGFYVAIDSTQIEMNDNDLQSCIIGFSVKYNGKYYNRTDELTDLFLMQFQDAELYSEFAKKYSDVVKLGADSMSKLISNQLVLNGKIKHTKILQSIFYETTECHGIEINYSIRNWFKYDNINDVEWTNILDSEKFFVAINQPIAQ